MNTVSIVLPTLNEAESLPHVLCAIPPGIALEVLVVDGGSTDGTPALARAGGARVVPEPRRGYGRACQSGLEAARGEIVVFLDADGADDPAALPGLLAPLLTGQADLALGSRIAGRLGPGEMPAHQWLGNVLAAALIRPLHGLALTDLSPFRAGWREKILALNLQEMTYGYPVEMIFRAARGGLRLVEVPVPYHKRIGGVSKITGTWGGSFKASTRIFQLILRFMRKER
jgi:glycosyltransferase involved in cell wall biosynthesis